MNEKNPLLTVLSASSTRRISYPGFLAGSQGCQLLWPDRVRNNLFLWVGNRLPFRPFPTAASTGIMALTTLP